MDEVKLRFETLIVLRVSDDSRVCVSEIRAAERACGLCHLF